MNQEVHLVPERASDFAASVDHLCVYLLAVSFFFSAILFVSIVAFSIKYRRRPGREIGVQIGNNLALELTWIAVPLILLMGMFFWGADGFARLQRPPAGALDVYVVARQWMWKIQHAEGGAEINELHVPLGRPVRLTMTSQDVIHSFYVPAFRLKQDLVPGRYTTLWFEPTKLGEFHLFCAQYCGTKHSGMTGRVVVQTPDAYARWLAGAGPEGTAASSGRRLFLSLGCAVCHAGPRGEKGPSLAGIFGRTVRLAGGAEATADESYLRESILRPQAKIVDGYQPLMPSFQDRVSEEDLIDLIAYLKSLTADAEPGREP